jgi:transposase
VDAPGVSRSIKGVVPGSGLLTHVLIANYADHVPVYRQSVIYGREGVGLYCSSLASWLSTASALLQPLGKVLRHHVFAVAKLYAGKIRRCL